MAKAPMTTTRRKPKRPFMIEKGGDFARIIFIATPNKANLRLNWTDWDGSTWATAKEARDVIDMDPERFEGANVIEILDEVRTTHRARV